MGGSWFDIEFFSLGFFIVEALFVGISYLLVLREVDSYYDDPKIKSPKWSMIKVCFNHIIAMNILLVIVFFIAIVLNILWGIIR